MTSGFGFEGGRSRCYGFWQDYFDWYVNADHPKQCSLDLDNYMECLHHKKEKSRVERIRKEWAKQQKAGHMPRTQKLEFNDEDSKKVASRLGFIDGSASKNQAGE